VAEVVAPLSAMKGATVAGEAVLKSRQMTRYDQLRDLQVKSKCLLTSYM
jgi:hypothetical protein